MSLWPWPRRSAPRAAVRHAHTRVLTERAGSNGSSGGSRVPARYDAFRRELAELSKEQIDAYGEAVVEASALTAGGQRVMNGQATLLRRLIQPWQIRAFGYYDILGEIKYAAQFYSRSLALLRLYVAYRDDDDELIPVSREKEAGPDGKVPDWDDEAAVVALDALARVRDPGGGGRAGLLAAYGRLMFLVGESYLFVSENPTTGLEQWEMLSTDELRLQDGIYTRYKSPSLAATQFRPADDDDYQVVARKEGATVTDDHAGLPTAVAYRLWRRHPRFSDLADATMEGVLELCEELVLLTQAVRARARSRLAGSGVLFIDQKITSRPLEAVPDEDPLEDQFLADLTEAMTAPIVDEGTASAVVPLVVRVTVPDGMKLSDLVYHLTIIDPLDVYPETGLRLECIRRIAIGLDMPAEILEGYTDANHWTAWMIDETSWKAHLQPVAGSLVEDLTSAYLTPYLKEQGVEGWERFVIAYDASAIINHPDRFKDAREAYDRRAIGKEALRDAGGFDEDDAMPQDELAESIGIAVRDTSLAWDGIPSPRSGNLETSPGVIENTSEEGAATGAEVEKGPPEKPEEEPLPETVLGSALAVARIEGASLMGLLRARDAAGARIRTLARRDRQVLDLIESTQNRDVASVLGRGRVQAILGGPREAELVDRARPLIADALRLSAPNLDTAVSDQIVETLEAHAVRGLYEPRVHLNGAFSQFVAGLLGGRS